MANKQVPTFCRICEPMCPFIAELDDDGKVSKLSLDNDNPLSRGYACHKGLSFAQVNQDPDRLNHPQRRINSKHEYPAAFEDVSWDEAFADIGEKIKAIQKTHGPDAVAIYVGNPICFNSRIYHQAYSLEKVFGTKYSFSANTQDLANKCAASIALYGSLEFLVPDIQNTDFYINFGSNPKISRGTVYVSNNPMEDLKGIKDRGGRILFVNPRKIESSTKDTGEVLQVKPDSDVYLMASLLNELDKLGAYDEAAIESQGVHIDGLRAFIANYPAARVADVVGVAADEIVQLAKDIAAAKSVAFHMGTGINQSRHGSLAFWLLSMLTFVTGNFGRKGGSYKPVGTFQSFETVQPDEPVVTPVGTFRPVMGDLPGNVMADLIQCEERPIKALINLSGNPVMSMCGEDKLRDAFKALELIVSIDIYPSATSEISDYVLPATDWLERADTNLVQMGSQLKPYVRYADAVVEPAGQRKNDWWIVSRLCRAIGKSTPLDDESEEGWALVEANLQGRGLTLEDIKSAPHSTLVLPEVDEYATTHERVVLNSDKKVDCCPKEFESAFDACEDVFVQLSSETGEELKLISMRTNYQHNTWLANMPQMRKGKHATNPLNMHPDDAAKRDLQDGQKVTAFNDHGQVETEIKFNDGLRPGVVAMTHGYGHQFAPRLTLASQVVGANVSRLFPTGEGSFEKLSGMSWMTGVPVEVRACSN